MPTQIQVSSASEVSIIATCLALMATISSREGVLNSPARCEVTRRTVPWRSPRI